MRKREQIGNNAPLPESHNFYHKSFFSTSSSSKTDIMRFKTLTGFFPQRSGSHKIVRKTNTCQFSLHINIKIIYQLHQSNMIKLISQYGMTIEDKKAINNFFLLINF